MSEIAADNVLDTKGLSCPMPVLKTKKALNDMISGDVLEVLTTDPGAVADIPALSKRLGHELIASKEDGGVYSFHIRKK